MGELGATWTQVFTCARGADVSFRDVKIKIPDRWMWMTSCTGSTRRILGDLKKSVSWVLPREKTVGFRLLAEARPVALWQMPEVLRWGGYVLCIYVMNIQWTFRISVSWLWYTLSSSFLLFSFYRYKLFMSSLVCKSFGFVINLFVFWSISLGSFLVHFKNGLEDLTRCTNQVFITLMAFLKQCWA